MDLEIKATHKPIKDYYTALDQFEHHGLKKETTVRAAFAEVLQTYARKMKWSFVEEYGLPLKSGNKGSVDGAILDSYSIPMGFWEAKDEQDDIKKEVKKKFEIGYPKSNILFQKPTVAVLYQDGVQVEEYDLTKPDRLVACLLDFFGYHAEEVADWGEVVDQFKERIPESAKKLVSMIEEEKKTNKPFQTAFANFATLCRASINPNLSDEAIEEMLVQHILTARIFAKVFDNPEFVRRNVIAVEIEEVIDALTSHSFNREDFYKPLNHFYVALENRAKSITDWSQKQSFLNTVYEKFFQGFAVKVADTHGIVYTPQPIVDFMVRSVQHILKTEFGRSLGDEGVHILDPFVGTGNFIMRIMKEIGATSKSKLPIKYEKELHCNEVMLLPYYIASLNIEHEYYTQTGQYKPFEGICLVDTFELAEPAQTTLFSTENSERVERQKKSPIFVIIGNPPYNAGQLDESDNNKNRRYPATDRRVEETYAKQSRANLKIKLKDPYVKAFRMASDKILQNGEGVVCFVSNNSFLDGLAFDGMRKQLSQEFDDVYVLDLGGNVRKNPKLSGTTNNVFGIQVGVAVTLLVKRKNHEAPAIIRYARLDEYWKKNDKYRFLNSSRSSSELTWTEITPDRNNTWFTDDLHDDFETFAPIGVKERDREKDHLGIFLLFSNGLRTNRDAWAYSFTREDLSLQIQRMIGVYNQVVNRFTTSSGKKTQIDSFLMSDETQIKWSGDLKAHLIRGKTVSFTSEKIREASYRPFTREFVYLDRLLNNSVYNIPRIFPDSKSELENQVIWLKIASNWPMFPLMVNRVPDFMPEGGSQCFPFYTYDEDGSNRRENITDWALAEFRAKLATRSGANSPAFSRRGAGGGYSPEKAKRKSKGAESGQPPPNPRLEKAGEQEISKWDIFYYVYGLLHHPTYRTKYAANLRRELPRIPIVGDAETFWKFSKAGKQLAELHVNYESQKEYPLEESWAEGSVLDLRVEKMKLTKDKTAIIYNDKLTLRGIPAEAFNYRLGNRSAIDWIIDQYQVSTDKRSGITNNPNREDDEMYILKLIKKVVTVSLETVRIVGGIEKLSLG